MSNIFNAEIERACRIYPSHAERLRSVQLVINKRFRQIMGRANWMRLTIEIADWLFKPGDEAELVDTIRHEIAHIITKCGDHGPLWRSAALMLGCSQSATCNKTLVNEPKKRRYTRTRVELQCPCCGATFWLEA